MTDSLIQFYRNHRCLPAERANITSMTGGKYRVNTPFDYTYYLAQSNYAHSLQEQVENISKLFIDIDGNNTDWLTPEIELTIQSTLITLVSKIYNTHEEIEVDILYNTKQPKQKVHIYVFPIICDKKERKYIHTQLVKELPFLQDKKVDLSNGLRIIGAYKASQELSVRGYKKIDYTSGRYLPNKVFGTGFREADNKHKQRCKDKLTLEAYNRYSILVDDITPKTPLKSKYNVLINPIEEKKIYTNEIPLEGSKERCTALVRMLGDIRADSYPTWSTVILCCKATNVDIEVAHEFSRKSKRYGGNKYNPYEVEKIYDTPIDVSWGEKQLRAWVKIDHPDEYLTFNQTKVKKPSLLLMRRN